MCTMNVHVGALVLPLPAETGTEGEHTRRIITSVPFPPRRCLTVATTINLWRVMAQARFCLNGQPCNSWTRVTAGTDAPGILARMPSPIFRGR